MNEWMAVPTLSLVTLPLNTASSLLITPTAQFTCIEPSFTPFSRRTAPTDTRQPTLSIKNRLAGRLLQVELIY